MSLPRVSALLILSVFCQFVFSATVNQEKEELSSLQRNLDRQEQKLASLKSELQKLPADLNKAQSDFDKAAAEYNAEKPNYDKLKQAHASAPSDSTERQLKLAEIKFGLAERRYDNAKADLDKLKIKDQALKSDIAKTESDIQASESKIRQQERRLADAVETAERLARESARAKQEQDQKAQLAAVAKPIQPPKAEIKIAAPEPTPPKVEEEKPKPNNVVQLTEEENKELQFAKEKMAEVNSRLADKAADDRPNFSSLELGGSNFEDIPFQYIGDQLYRTDVTLYKGRHSFRVDDFRFQMDVPDSVEGPQVYVFLIDASSRGRLKASYFRKDLLGYFDKEVVIVKPEPTLAEKVAKSGVIETPDGVFMSKDEYKEFQFAKKKITELETLVASAKSDDKPNFDVLELRNSDLGDTPFQYLGNQQYRLDIPVAGGRQTFRIDSLQFNVDIRQADTPQVYVFLVDARDKNSLRASYFRKGLLNYADKEVAVAQ